MLVTAEMMGVKAGLGWYLQWAQGWAAYANMYAALLVMAVLCSGLITLLFTVRDRVLSWHQFIVPQFYSGKELVAAWNRFSRPEKHPKYAPLSLDTWWVDEAKDRALKRGEGK